MVSFVPDSNKVFISYSHKDAKYLESLLPHLQNLEKNKPIDCWVDTKIIAGKNWQVEIENALAATKVAILLISIDFLNSPFIVKNELPPLLFAAEAEGVIILPVILRPCDLPPSLSRLQAINSPDKPLSKLKGYEREELWVKVAKATAKAINTQTDGRNMVMRSKVYEEELSNGETDDEEELDEALQEMERRLSLNLPWIVLPNQSETEEKEEHGKDFV